MRFQVAALRNNIAKTISEALDWEEGKKAERLRKWEDAQDVARAKQVAYADACREISNLLYDAESAGTLITKDRISEIWERHGAYPDVRRYDSGIPETVRTREQVLEEMTPHTEAVLAGMDHLTKILDLTSDSVVSTHALQQAGYRGRIPLG